MKVSLRSALLLFVCLATTFAAERPGHFRIIGPGGGGAMFNPTVSPHDANTVLISCDMTGSYITHDGGKTWRMFNLRGVVDFFAFDPKDPKTMYAHATGLWRSTDGGENWNLAYPNPATVKGVKMASDHSDEDILADPDPLGTIFAFAIDPDNSKVLYAAAGSKANPALFVSHDAGKNWTKQVDLLDAPRRVWVDPKSPADSRTLFIGSVRALASVTGIDVKKLSVPEETNDISLGFGTASQPTVYATSKQGVFASTDGGRTWGKSTLPGEGSHVRAVATSLQHPEVAYVSYNRLLLDGKHWMGVARTSDSGKTWTLGWKEG